MVEKELKAKIREFIKKVIKKMIAFQYPESNYPTLEQVPLYIKNKSDKLISMYINEDYNDYIEKRILVEYNKALKTKDGQYFLEFLGEELYRNAILNSEGGADVSDMLIHLKNDDSIRVLKENVIEKNKLDIIKQIHHGGIIELGVQEASLAIKNSHKDILNYFLKNHIVEPNENILMYAAVTYEKKDMQEFLVDNGATIQIVGISSDDKRLNYIKEYKRKKEFSDNLKINLEEKPLSKKIKI